MNQSLRLGACIYGWETMRWKEGKKSRRKGRKENKWEEKTKREGSREGKKEKWREGKIALPPPQWFLKFGAYEQDRICDVMCSRHSRGTFGVLTAASF